jgi:F-type H+-transporting ATPase subunit a
MELNNKVLWIMTIGGAEFWITETIRNTWIIMAVLITLAIVVRIKLSKFTEIGTTGFQNIVESIVEAMDNFVVSTMTEKYAFYGNYFFGVFLFIACSNMSGLFGLRPPTADLTATATLGFMTFIIIHISGIAAKGPWGYFKKEYLEPNPVFFPINFIGNLVPPVSLSFRLFGNLFGGMVVMGLLYYFMPGFLSIGIPVPLHGWFDVFISLLQTYIFTMLSMTYIRNKLLSQAE